MAYTLDKFGNPVLSGQYLSDVGTGKVADSRVAGFSPGAGTILGRNDQTQLVTNAMRIGGGSAARQQPLVNPNVNPRNMTQGDLDAQKAQYAAKYFPNDPSQPNAVGTQFASLQNAMQPTATGNQFANLQSVFNQSVPYKTQIPSAQTDSTFGGVQTGLPPQKTVQPAAQQANTIANNSAIVDALRQKPQRFAGFGMGAKTPNGLFQSI